MSASTITPLAKAQQCLSDVLANIKRAEDTIHRVVGHTYSRGQWSGTLEEAFVFALQTDSLNYSERIEYTNALRERRLGSELRDKQYAIINDLTTTNA